MSIKVCDPDMLFKYDGVITSAAKTVKNINREDDTVNRSTTVFLVDNTVKAFTAIYEDGHKTEYFKTFMSDVKKDDLMVVESGTRHGYTVVKVVDPSAVVDIKDTQVQVKWAIARLDLTEHKEILKQEADAVEKVKAAEFNKMRKDLIDNMVGPDADALRNIHVNPALPAPTKPAGHAKT